MFKIGDFSKLTRVSVRMLRYYDKIELLKPHVVDTYTGYRFYSADQIPKVHRIQVLQRMGFTLSEICGLMERDLDTSQLRTILLNRKREILKALKNEQERLLRVETLIEFIDREDCHLKYDIELKSVPAYRVLSLRDRLPAYHAEGLLWEEIQTFVQENKIQTISPSYAIYHDEGFRENNVDVEVAIAIEHDVKETDRIKARKLAAVSDMAVLYHAGPFEEISSAYHALGVWMAANNYELDGPTRAIYHKGPWCEEDPINYLTEVQAPVTKKK